MQTKITYTVPDTAELVDRLIKGEGMTEDSNFDIEILSLHLAKSRCGNQVLSVVISEHGEEDFFCKVIDNGTEAYFVAD